MASLKNLVYYEARIIVERDQGTFYTAKDRDATRANCREILRLLDEHEKLDSDVPSEDC